MLELVRRQARTVDRTRNVDRTRTAERPRSVSEGQLQLMRDAKRHRIDILTVSPRSQVILGGDGVIVTELFVKAVES